MFFAIIISGVRFEFPGIMNPIFYNIVDLSIVALIVDSVHFQLCYFIRCYVSAKSERGFKFFLLILCAVSIKRVRLYHKLVFITSLKFPEWVNTLQAMCEYIKSECWCQLVIILLRTRMNRFLKFIYSLFWFCKRTIFLWSHGK